MSRRRCRERLSRCFLPVSEAICTLSVAPLVQGTATGVLVVLDEPLSLWGGVDPETGLIVDTHHPQHGRSIRGSLLVMPGGRGSSSSSSVLVELVRRKLNPVSLLLFEADPILIVGALMSRVLYDIVVPVALVDPALGIGAHRGRTGRIDGPSLTVFLPGSSSHPTDHASVGE